MSKAKLTDLVANAISKADSSYFFEDYTKQATAVLAALEKAGYAIIPNDYPDATWQKVADVMRTGTMKPHEHVKNVYQTVLRVVGEK